MLVPLGAKAQLSFENNNLANLKSGNYTLKITDISGVSWNKKLKNNSFIVN
ncbi:MAG: TQO small subunit DoxA domain-containing protein [Saprospiraceae bacterium]